MTAEIENIVYTSRLDSTTDERTLVRSWDEETNESIDGWADVAHEAVRAMNHITNSAAAVPAPVAYSVLGNVAGLAQMLPQLFEQLANGLQHSLDVFDVYDRKGDPRLSVIAAGEQLQAARLHAQRMAECLEAAQIAINSQGYNESAEHSADLSADIEGGL